MAQIKGIDNLSKEELNRELSNGAKFVIYTYVISIIVASFRRSSDIYFVKSDQMPIRNGWQFFLISFFLGWWGIPWGPIYTFQSLYHAFAGKDVTDEVRRSLNAGNTNTGSSQNQFSDMFQSVR